MWNEYVLDATLGCQDGLFCFCPIEGDIHGDYEVVVGLSFLSGMLPRNSKLVAVIHADGQEAVEEFCQKYAKELEALKR